ELGVVLGARHHIALHLGDELPLVWACGGIGHELTFGGLGDDDRTEDHCAADGDLGGFNLLGWVAATGGQEGPGEGGGGAQEKGATTACGEGCAHVPSISRDRVKNQEEDPRVSATPQCSNTPGVREGRLSGSPVV